MTDIALGSDVRLHHALGTHARVRSEATGALYSALEGISASLRDPWWANEVTSDPVPNYVDGFERPWRGEIAIMLMGMAVSELPSPAGSLLAGPERAVPVQVDDDVDLTLQEAAQELRDVLNLSVADLARMVGIQRRRFYDLLSGQAASDRTGGRVMALHQVISKLNEAVGGNPDYLRSAVLTPLGIERRTIYEAAVEDDGEGLQELGELMLARIAQGTARFGRRPVPRHTISERGRQRAHTAVESLPSRRVVGVADGRDR